MAVATMPAAEAALAASASAGLRDIVNRCDAGKFDFGFLLGASAAAQLKTLARH